MKRIVVAAGLLACASPSKPRPVANTGVGYPWFDRVDVVVVRDGKLVAYALGAGPTELARLDIPSDGAPFVSGAWGDRDHLFLRAGERRVVQLSRHGVVDVAIPPRARFATPRPDTDNAKDLVEGGPVDEGGLIVTDRGAFWAECPWGFPADGFQCEGWRLAQLWPTPSKVVAQPTLPAHVEHFAFPDAAPAGAALEQERDGLVCTLGGPSTRIDPTVVDPEAPAAPDDAAPTWQLHADSAVLGAHWLSAQPPRLLVRWGSPGYDSLVEYAWTMHDGCRPAPIDKGDFARPGPAPFWLDDSKRIEVRRGTERIMTVPAESTVFFRPRARS